MWSTRAVKSTSFPRYNTSQVCGAWKILFFGSDAVSLATLRRLHADKELVERLEVVVTQSKFSEVAKWCAKENVISHTWSSVLRHPPQDFDLGVVVSFGHLVPAEMINHFPKKMINVHPSLLPRYRGAAPIQHALLNLEKETGVCVIDLHPTSFDKGNIILREVVPISEKDTFNTLMPKLADIGAEQVLQVLNNFEELSSKKFPQPELPEDEKYKAKAPKLPSHNPILWDQQDNLTIYANYRAMPTKASAFFKNKEFRLTNMQLPPKEIPRLVKEKELILMRQRGEKKIPEEARYIPDEGFASTPDLLGAGTIVYHRPSKSVYVRCLKGWIAVKELRIPTQTKPVKPYQFFAAYLNTDVNKLVKVEKIELEDGEEEKKKEVELVAMFSNGKVPEYNNE